MVVQQQDIAREPVFPNAQITVPEFVKQYYNVLVVSPQSLCKFYENPSILSRPSLNGQPLSLTSLIRQQITSPGHNKFNVEIKTVDSQTSHNNGVLVLVCGSITFINNATRSFTQTFFLAPRENGYLVFNDIFRYVDEEPHQTEPNFLQTSGYPKEHYVAHADAVSEPVVVSEMESKVQISVVKKLTTLTEEVHMGRKEVASGSGGQFENISAVEEVHNQGQPTATQETLAVFQAAPEKSQGFNVKENEEKSRCCIFVSRLPVHITPPEVEEEFKKFGAIKPYGVRLRSRRTHRSCYAFVEFEEEASAQAAIQASPIPIRGRKVAVSAIRPTQTDALPSTLSSAEESGCSIFISNMHADITRSQVEEEFKKFGEIKPSGVRVRTMKGKRSSYAFVEFEDAASAQAAIQASQMRNIQMGARTVAVSAMRPIADREGFRNDGPITIPMAVKDMREAIL